MERGADYISIGALVTAVITWIEPGMLVWLTEISEIAALFMPPLALLWVGTQLWFNWFKGK